MAAGAVLGPLPTRKVSALVPAPPEGPVIIPGGPDNLPFLPPPVRFPGCQSFQAPPDCEAICEDQALLYPRDPTTGRIYVTFQDGSVWLCDDPCQSGIWDPRTHPLAVECRRRSGFVAGVTLCPGDCVSVSGVPPGLTPGPSPIPPFPDPGGPGFRPPPGPGPLPFLPVGPDIPTLESILRLLGDGRLDLSGVIRVLVAGLGLGERVRGVIQEVAPRLLQGLAPEFRQVALALQQQRDTAEDVAAAEQILLGDQTSAIGGLAGKVWGGLLAVLGPLLEGLAGAAGKIFAPLLEQARKGAEELVEGILKVYRDSIEAKVPIDSRNVSEVAGTALANALAAGITAQALSVGLELLHPLKRIGLNQVVGFFADFGGFSQIAGPLTGPTLKWGLGKPSEHRAAAKFRTELPAPRDALEQAFQRHISLQDYASVLALHGFPSWWIKVLVDDTFVDPRSFDIARILDASEASPEWLTFKLREVGWDDTDVQIGTRALMLKTQAPGRGRVESELLQAFDRGQLREQELDAGLEGVGLRPEHKALWLRAARLSRRGAVMEAIAERTTAQYQNDVATRDEARQLLEGAGFTREEVNLRLLLTDMDRRVVQVRKETREVESELRRIQSAAFDNLRRQFRAGFLGFEEFLAWGEVLGFSEAYLRNIAAIEQLKGPPARAEELPPVGTGALQDAAQVLVTPLRELVRRGLVTQDAAQVLLTGLGLPADLARDLLAGARILGLPVPSILELPFPLDGGVRSGWEAILAAVLERIRRGEGGTNLLGEILNALGIPERHAQDYADVIRTLEEIFFRARS